MAKLIDLIVSGKSSFANDINAKTIYSTRLYMSGAISTYNHAGTWISGRANAAIRFNDNGAITSGSYHSFYTMKSYAGNVISFGGINNNIGFYGYLASRPDSSNDTDYSFVCDSCTGVWTSNKNIGAAGFVKAGSNNSKVLLGAGSDASISELSVKHAGTAGALTTSNAGGIANPVYFSGGIPVACSSTVGGVAKPVYMNAGTITACSSTVGGVAKPVYMSSGTITACSSTVGGVAKPVYMNAGTITVCSSTVGGVAKPVYMSSGTITACSSTVGSSTKPVYMNAGTITASDASIGSSSKPIYLKDGVITASTSTLGSGSKPIYMSSGTLTASTSTVGAKTQPVYMSSGTITATDACVGAWDRPVYMSSGTITQTTYRMAMTNAVATTAVAIDSTPDTGIWYVNDTSVSGLYKQTDGVAIVNKYSSSWISQIYQDYRTGQIAVRGKNNGAWQAWRKILDSTNYTDWVYSRSQADSKFLERRRMRNPSDGTAYHGSIPFILALKGAGYPVYTDPEFASGNNSVAVYNNSGGSAVSISRTEDTTGANSSGYILKITSTTGYTSPGRGGFYQTINARQNAVFAQIFRAKIPTGFSVTHAENHMGDGYTTYWLTDTAGTGKWEWYCRITICGSGGTYSSGGHVYLSGSGAVTWYLAYCNVIDLTYGKYDGLRTRYTDYANDSDKLDGIHASGLFTNLSNSGNNISVTIGGTNKTLTVGYATNAGNADTLDNIHASGLFTNLSNSGNNISVTIGGTNKTLTVGYASNADKLDGIHATGLFTNLSNSGNNISVTIGGTNKTLTVGYASNADTVDSYHASSFEAYHKVTIDTTSLDVNTWYPVTMDIGTAQQTRIRVEGRTSTTGSWNTRADKLMAVMLDYTVQGSSWGWISPFRAVYEYELGAGAGGSSCVAGLGQLTNSSTEYVHVRGGAKYDFYVSRFITPVLRTSTYTISSQSIAPTTTVPAAISRNIAYISDTVAAANKLTTDAGSGTNPIYFSGGKPVASSSTVGDVAKPVYLSSGTITPCSSTVGGVAKPVYMNAGTITVCSSTVGGVAKPVYMSSGTITACSSTVGGVAKPVYMNAGTITVCSSTVGGVAKPVYMSSGTITVCSSTVGTSGRPVYMNAGTITAISVTASTSTLYVMGVTSSTSSLYTGTQSSNGVRLLSGNTLYAYGGFYESSDERLKDFGNEVEVDLDKILQLPKVYFTWKDDESKKSNIGTSAQELQKIYPELVGIDDDGILHVAYDKLSIIALRGIDKLYKEITDLKKRVETLEST